MPGLKDKYRHLCPTDLAPARDTLIYVVAATLWILSSDILVARFSLGLRVATLKGFAFVAVTAVILYSVLSQADKKLREFGRVILESEQRFTHLVENAPDGIFVQTGGRFRYLNSAALKCFGASSPEELINREVLERIHPDFQQAVRERIRQLNQTSQAVPLAREKIVRLDNKIVNVEVSAVPYVFEGQSGALVFLRDITDRVRAEAENRLLEAKFYQAQKLESVGRLTAGIAHDFNNQLTLINGYAELLERHVSNNEHARNALSTIREAGREGAALAAQLLAFSRRDVFAPKLLDIDELLRRSERMVRRVMGRDIKVRVEVQPSVGRILADESRMNQIIMNLAMNARDAMSNGGVFTIAAERCEIDAEYTAGNAEARKGSTVVISFADSGAGMSSDTQARIFEPFFTTKPEGRGTGLGLSTVHGIVKQLGGWITVVSELEKGTQFTIFIPACDEQPSSAPVVIA